MIIWVVQMTAIVMRTLASMEAFGLWGSGVGDVQVGAADAPVGGEVLHCVALDVSLHGDQAAAELQAHRALVWRGPAVSPQVLDHGWVVPWALTTEATLEWLFTLMQSEERAGSGVTGRKRMEEEREECSFEKACLKHWLVFYQPVSVGFRASSRSPRHHAFFQLACTDVTTPILECLEESFFFFSQILCSASIHLSSMNWWIWLSRSLLRSDLSAPFWPHVKHSSDKYNRIFVQMCVEIKIYFSLSEVQVQVQFSVKLL